MRVIFRTDSSIQIGSGHLMRCLTLAHELRRRGADVSFITRELDGHLITKLEMEGFQVLKLNPPTPFSNVTLEKYVVWLGVTQEEDAAETLRAIDDTMYDWLIVDHYALDKTWESILRPKTKKIMVIDDLANRIHDCDILLDQNYFGHYQQCRYEQLVPEFCKCLLGPHHALLQPEYKQFRKVLPLHDGSVRRLLIFFGASDPDNQTSKMLQVLNCQALASLAVDVVIGPNHPDPESIAQLAAARPYTSLHRNLSSLAGLMARADLMIGAGGATTWERMCLGLPAIVMTIAENQEEFSRALSEEHYQVTLVEDHQGLAHTGQQAILQLIAQPEKIRTIANKARALVDGFGAARVVQNIFGRERLDIKIRQVTSADEEILFSWVNEPEVRMQSFCQKTISKAEHAQWLAKMLNNSAVLILIGQLESGLPVGQVRFDMNQQEMSACIDISIDASLRGMGISELLLAKAIQYFFTLEPKMKLIAEVKETNRRSQCLFTKLQFTHVPSQRVKSKMYELWSC